MAECARMERDYISIYIQAASVRSMHAALRSLSVGAMTKQHTYTGNASAWQGTIAAFMGNYWDDVAEDTVKELARNASSGTNVTKNDNLYIELELGTAISNTAKKPKYTRRTTIFLHKRSGLGMYTSIHESLDDDAYDWPSRLYVAKFNENNASGMASAWRAQRVNEFVAEMKREPVVQQALVDATSTTNDHTES